MGFAANGIMDVVAPPPSARGSNASADDTSAPSFQDHVDASDQRPRRNDPPRSQRETNASSDRSSPSSSSDQANLAHPDPSQDDTKQDAEASAAPINPPVLLVLIANATPAVLGAKAEQPSAAQHETTPADQAANASAAQAAALAAAVTTPTKAGPKSETAPRTAEGKTAKGATAKTTAVADDSKTALAQTLAPTPQVPTTQPTTTPSLTSSIADSGAKSEENAEADGVEAVTSGSTRSAQQSRQPAPPASPPAAPEPTPHQPEVAHAKDRDSAKASAPLDALKQAVQDLGATTPKTPASSVPPPAAHAQLAEPVQQAASDTSAARVAPAAAQVGGEIIRRFNGQDTSFQLRLDPPELGRVDVRLDVSRDHRVTAVISADSPQALSDLARGARDLQQALQSAGLDLADDGLRFNLSSNGQGSSFAQAQAQQDQANLRAASAAPPETPIAPEVTASRPLSIDRWRGSRVDLVA